MTALVIDASIAVKWFVPESPEEADVPKALALLSALRSGNIRVFQPPHWEAEVAAVLARLTPENAVPKMVALRTLIVRRVEHTGLYATALDLAVQLKHHLFDTLYHATALHVPGAVYVTADARYYAKARDLGQITLLANLDLPR
jgi:predicted nucleic acid-binding protein